MQTISLMIIAPLLFAFILPFSSVRVRNLSVYVLVAFLSFLTIDNLISQNSFKLILDKDIHTFFIFADSVLLLFFLYVGLKSKDKLVTFFALIQMVLYGIYLKLDPSFGNYDIIADQLSSYMFFVINIVGGIIVIYALKYMDYEDIKQCKKNLFIALLLFFIGVMNFIVCVNNIEIFFLLFELTTLCSYLLIRFRGDEISKENSLRALWMNQIGGVAILISLLASINYYDTIYFNELLLVANDYILLPIVFLILAAFVKGASYPFDRWLLGAMVAPTPVSAMLHSATMVKIAPFLILKLSSSFTPFVSSMVTLFGTFVFLSASVVALKKDFFKEILGLSTIALLALMVVLASIGTKEAVMAAVVLLVFHAISKAMLFLIAGVLEKTFHLKNISDIESFIQRSPQMTFLLIVGFASLTLPPFGAFIGKLAGIEALNSMMNQNPIYVVSFIFMVVGSAVLTLLYFKVITKFLPLEPFKEEKIDIEKGFSYPVWFLFFLTLAAIWYLFSFNILENIEIIVPAILFLVTIGLFYSYRIKDAIRVKEYNCGEKDNFEVGSFYISFDKKYEKYIYYMSIALIALVILGGF